jgi:hypothetical protein
LRELVLVSRTPLDHLDALFAADSASRVRAYTLAAAFVRDIHRRYGADAAANILRRVGGATRSSARSHRQQANRYRRRRSPSGTAIASGRPSVHF